MSAYRDTTRNGVLVREKRGLIWRWRWKFNRSLEDHLTTLLNQRVIAKIQLRTLQRSIPLVEARLVAVKKKLAEDHGGTSPVYLDSFHFRKEPVRVKEPVGKPKKPAGNHVRQHPDAGVIAKLVAPIAAKTYQPPAQPK